MALSILVCSIDTRYDTFALRLLSELFRQRNLLPDPALVEVIAMTDTKSMSIGAKRNALVRAASGAYVQFVDDDDRVDAEMVEAVLEATRHRFFGQRAPDVITFPVQVSLAGGPGVICRYSKSFGHDRNTPRGYLRIPNHICPVRRELALQTPFADICMGEDADYAKRLLPKLEYEYQIMSSIPLYYYDFNPRTSECRR